MHRRGSVAIFETEKINKEKHLCYDLKRNKLKRKRNRTREKKIITRHLISDHD